MRTHGLACGVVGMSLLAACGSDKAEGASSAAPTASVAATVVTSTSTTSVAAPAPTAPAPTAVPVIAAGPSEEPSLPDWGKAREVKLAGSGKVGCETKMVREWLRVMCVPRSTELGKPVSIRIDRGRDGARPKGENLKAVNDITTLIVPVRPGTDFSATFAWEQGSHVLTVTLPSSGDETERAMSFDVPEPETAAPSEPAPPGEAVKPEPASADIEGFGALPTEEAWRAEKEVRVSGSSALGCETKLLGGYFRAKCKAPSDATKLKNIVFLKGHKKTQSTAKVEGDTSELVTPYVDTTETHARFELLDGTSRVLVLRWPKGPMPTTLGALEAPR